MRYYNEFFKNIIIYNLILKYPYLNFYQIFKINKIILNFGFKNLLIKNKIKNYELFLLLKLLTNQFPKITKSRKNILEFKIKKNNIVGCKLTLRKKNALIFLDKLLFKILQNKKINFNNNNSFLNFKINNYFDFTKEIEKILLFENMPTLDISIQNSNKLVSNNNELLLFLTESLFPIQKKL